MSEGWDTAFIGVGAARTAGADDGAESGRGGGWFSRLRENLKRSADELKVQVDDAKAALGEAFEELKKVEMLDERDQAREKAEANAREQTELDRIAALRFGAGGATA